MNDIYAAGLFDGEGYVRIARWQKPNSPHIRWQVMAGIGMTHRPVIEALAAAYGGSLHNNRHDLRSDKNRIQFGWVVASQIAASFLRRVLPHLIVKKDQAELALKLQASIDEYRHKLGGGHRCHERREEIREYRETLCRMIYDAKHVSFDPLLKDGPVNQ